MLTSLFRTTTPTDLNKVEWLIHDCWFDLDQLKLDQSTHRVDLTFGRGKAQGRSEIAPDHYDCALTIRNSESLVIDDEAEIGVYDINTIRYEGGVLVIESGFPLIISIGVDGPDVDVQTRGVPHSDEGGLSWYTEGKDIGAYLSPAPSG